MSSVLNRIRRTLTDLSAGDVKMEGVWYGACSEKQLEYWNYFVFNRWKTSRRNASKIDFQTSYQVHVIHEDYIPEGFVEKVVEALEAPDESGTKLRATGDDITYNYIFKSNTNMVVEIATITLYHPKKRC